MARSLAVLGRADALAKAVGGSLCLAHGVLSTDTHETSKLRGIRAALQQEVQSAQPVPGRRSKAISAVERLARPGDRRDRSGDMGTDQVTRDLVRGGHVDDDCSHVGHHPSVTASGCDSPVSAARAAATSVRLART